MEFHTAKAEELSGPDLGRFYKRNGYKGKISKADRCYWLSSGTTILAAAKTSLHKKTGALILNGVWVDKHKRNQGLATQLLKIVLTKSQLEAGTIYCFAYPGAVNLYRRLGFTECDEHNCPMILIEQQKHYKQRGTETTLLALAI